ncbi:major facilitator family transporter [Nitzschia inconspicua]|uniref:Major facilitator family transporter n=1 Tax=Nitzschia inconspicua TaxID=303405 RepID=A0A9K3PQ06_9STRA|nr:major facilitator family transporter [Nitzschia inconspicua]
MSSRISSSNSNRPEIQQQQQQQQQTYPSVDDQHDSTTRTTIPQQKQKQQERIAPNQTIDAFLERAFQSSQQQPQQQQQSLGLLSVLLCQWRYWCIMVSLGVANSSDASEILCLSYILSDDTFQQRILQTQNGGWLAAAVFLGMLVGGLLVGTMGDWFGRRPMLLMGLCCNSVAGMLSSVATNVQVLTLLRCVSGLGIGATVPPLFTLVTELAPPSARGFCVTLCASFWMVGSIFVAVVALWLLEKWNMSWRIFAMVCALPSAVGALLVYCLVPESPRFLGLEQRWEEATDVTNLLAQRMGFHNSSMMTINDLQHSFPTLAIQDFELHRLQRMDRTNSQHPTTSRPARVWQLLRRTQMDFVQATTKLYTPQLKKTTWPLQMVWFSLSFGSYGLVTWINSIFVQVHLQNVYFNALLFASSNLPGNLITAICMDRMRRGRLLTGSIVAAALSLIFFAICANTGNQFGIVLSACSFQCFTIAAWNTIDTMTSELFPTLVRSTGMGVCAASGRIGAMLAQFVNGYLVNHGHPVLLLLVASGTLVLGAATPYLLPGGGDMTGRPVHDNLTVDTTVEGVTLLLYQRIPSSTSNHGQDGTDDQASVYRDDPVITAVEVRS